MKRGERLGYVDFSQLNAAVSSEEMLNATIDYLCGCLKQFLRPHDRLLICFPDNGTMSLGNMLARAASRAGASTVFWGRDRRWKALLRIAFTTRATAIAAPPLIVLGLAKLAKATATPLYFRNVLTAGYPCLDWMIDGIARILDCATWGCFGPGTGAVVGGFSCGCSRGVHIRTEDFAVEIVDAQGTSLPDGQVGTPVISPRHQPQLRYHSGLKGRLDFSPCECGQNSPRLMDISAGTNSNAELSRLGRQMLYWTSVLDCDLRVGDYGLEIELVVFPGEKLPKLPTCAKQSIRPWDPERDTPLVMASVWNK